MGRAWTGGPLRGEDIGVLAAPSGQLSVGEAFGELMGAAERLEEVVAADGVA